MYQTIKYETTYELIEKKSKFIAHLVSIKSREDAESKIKEFKKKYYDARHNCYAYRVINKDSLYEKSSDDGEPSGTAGAPMLSILQKNNLVNVLIIVTRYFGGILLGTGGLVRCYSGATTGAVQNSEITTITNGTEFQIEIDYTDFRQFEYYCKTKNIQIIDTLYSDKIFCKIQMDNSVKEEFLKDVQNKHLKVIKIEEIGDILVKKC